MKVKVLILIWEFGDERVWVKKHTKTNNKIERNVKMGIHISDVFSYKIMNGLKV